MEQMMEKIIELLKENTQISAWKVDENFCHSCELYYVGHKPETNRVTDTISWDVTLYTDWEKQRGAASFRVYPYMTAEKIQECIAHALYAASFAGSPFFELPKPEGLQPLTITDSSFPEDRSFNELIEELADAVFSADTFPDGSLNATEFFLYHEKERICNSNGIDLTREASHGAIEIIPSWTSGSVEAEVIHMIRFSDFQPEKIAAEVREELLLAKARCEAKPLEEVLHADTAALEASPKIILQDQEVEQVLDYFSADLSYALKYRHANRTELGDSVQGAEVTGTRLNLKRIPYYPGAVASRPFDADGVFLKDTELICDGIAVSRFGFNQYGYYLGEKSPVGRLPILEVKPGTRAFAEMTTEPYIRCVKFSGLQVDPFSDFFGGEVRLGFYFDGEKEIPVTGFAISGNMSKEKGTMLYSSETQTLPNFHGPKYLEIFGMTAM